jgi:hypothetical protein
MALPPGGYSLILHGPRKKFDLSLPEACLASLVYHLGRSPRAPFPGWCSVGTQKLADFIGDTTRQTVHRHLGKLHEKGLVEKDPNTNYIRTTILYYDEFESFHHEGFLGREQNIPVPQSGGNGLFPALEQNIPAGGIKSSPISNSKVKSKVINNNQALLESLACYSPELDNAFEEFKAARKLKRPLTAYAERLAIDKLAGLAGSDIDLAIKLVNQSILLGHWTFYPLQSDNSNGGGQRFQGTNGQYSRPGVTAHSGGKKDFADS